MLTSVCIGCVSPNSGVLRTNAVQHRHEYFMALCRGIWDHSPVFLLCDVDVQLPTVTQCCSALVQAVNFDSRAFPVAIAEIWNTLADSVVSALGLSIDWLRH